MKKIEEMTDEELNQFKVRIEKEKERRRNKKVEKAQEDFRTIIKEYHEQGIGFYINDYGTLRFLDPNEVYAH